MWQQISAIAWAQYRITRNHLPRTGFGTVLGWLLMSLWYGLYLSFALLLAWKLPAVPFAEVAQWLPAGLLGVFLFWQIIPLFTLSSGWSLELDKLQIYPVSNSSLFGIETLLRISSAPEMLIVLGGLIAGLARHPQIPSWAPFALLLLVPVNLFLQLAFRDLILHSFERNRFRELFAVLVISVGVVPQLLLRTGLGRALKPYFFAAAGSHVAPWYEAASLAIGRLSLLDFMLLLCWIVLSSAFARWMFQKSLVADDSFRSVSVEMTKPDKPDKFSFSSRLASLFRDPLATLIQKELQSLIRMPRFRVLFGMSCLLGIVVFIPASLNGRDVTSEFMRNNLIPVVNVYGLLLLSDTLMLNAFGLDRGAAQTFFVTPVSLAAVLAAKNITAIFFVALQSAVILLVAALARAPITPVGAASGLLASAVVTVYLLATGNLTSVSFPRPIDPRQTFKKQAGAKMQIWLLVCSLGLFVIVGFAFLARYAFQRDWALLAVLGFELLVGLIVYRFALESAVARGVRGREAIVQSLSKSASPVSLS